MKLKGYLLFLFVLVTIAVLNVQDVESQVMQDHSDLAPNLEPLTLYDNLLLQNHLQIKEVEQEGDFTELFTYQEVLALQDTYKRLPTLEELTAFLKEAGFNSEMKEGLISDTYYKLGLQYPGIVDPILGLTQEGEKVGLWFKENGEGQNYLSIEKDELKYEVGRMHPQAKISVRYISLN